MTKIFIVDDHPVVREGLVAALEGKNGIEIAGAFASAEDALAARAIADVIVLDLELPGAGGLASIEKFSAPVLVLTAYDADEDVDRALAAGARGYLLKGAPLDDIERAIAAVARGDSYLGPRIASRLVRRDRHDRLTNRERDVLKLAAAGDSNKVIAKKLKIAERTAKFHMSSIFNKLGAENRAQAVAIAAARHLI